MSSRRISAPWLSEEMARALAAMCPPLQVVDVLRTADKLSEPAATPGVVLVEDTFRSDVDRVNLRNVIEALQALRDLRRGSWP
jgi:hypothetical protein